MEFDDLHSIFEDVKKEFLNNLSVEEQALFHPVHSTKDLLAGLENLEATQKKARRRALPLLQAVQKFGDNIEPFFKVVEILCAAHPEWANIALGALRLLLQLASHFVTFFEKLCQVIKRLDATLPRYNEVFESLAKSSDHARQSERLLSSLRSIFKLLFEFFVAVARVFSKNGKIKKTPIVIAELMWKPFNARFEGILESLDFHNKVLEEELKFLLLGKIYDKQECHARVLHETEELIKKLEKSSEKHSKDAFLASALKWLCPPPNFREHLEQAQMARYDDTAEWIFDNPTFISWRQDLIPFTAPTRYLWVTGNPGSGKTVLAGSILDELQRESEDEAFSNPVFYYFFNQTSGTRNESTDAYRSIATQILQKFSHDQKIQDMFTFSMSYYPVQTKATGNELLALIRKALCHLSDATIVLDGIDECDSVDKLCKETFSWCRDGNVKLLVLSRPNVAPLRRHVKTEAQIMLPRMHLDEDITTYLTPMVLDMKEDGLLSSDLREDDIVERLVSRAEGMFLWARLMITYLHSPALTRTERTETIMVTTPDGIGEVYQRIHSQVLSLDRPSRELACNALTWTMYCPRQLGCSEMRHAIKPGDYAASSEASNSQFHDALILSCCGLLEKSYKGGVYQYIHLSARDYLLSQTSQGDHALTPLVLEEHQAHAQILKRFVSILAYELPLRPLSEMMGRYGLDDIKEAFPLLQIASEEWIPSYLAHSNPCSAEDIDMGVSQLISNFLSLRLNVMIWIESLYTFSATFIAASGRGMSAQATQSLKHHNLPTSIRTCLSEVSQLLVDLQDLDQDWGPALSANPSALWEDITLFSKSRFLVPTKAGSLQSFAPSLRVDGKETSPTFSVSRSSEDGNHLATLAIYPPRAFIEQIGANGRLIRENKGSCDGWIVNFEVQALDQPQTRTPVRTTVHLETEGVKSFFSRIFPHIENYAPQAKVPLSIKPDLDGFTVFDSIFLKCPTSRSEYVSSQLGLHLTDAHLDALTSYPHDFYEYEVSWTLDGHYILYVDTYQGSFWTHVFRAEYQQRKLGVKLINCAPFGGFRSSKSEMLSHPSIPVLAYTFQGNIYLWAFNNARPFLFFELAKFPFHTRRTGQLDSTCIAFSHCGKYLVISSDTIGNGRPITLPIPQLFPTVDRQIKRKASIDRPDSRKQHKSSARTKFSHNITSLTGESIPSAVSNSNVVLSSNSSGTVATTVQKNVLPYSQFELVQTDSGGGKRAVPVLQFPMSIQPGSVSATIHATDSDTQSKRLKIILNKTSLEGRMDTDGPEPLPLVIWKDPRSLARRNPGSQDSQPLLKLLGPES
ncbi:hypothetical protein B0T10DRAFT_486893 [Thelonectria olida]|uniref:NACHT domain-containing protein n=1 Tax=Thelonectria olida TaxID=1576542 RepID=A0A9P8W821_9HYPO|nr:hypothetical protein B0T10DRAFT_486893 [Thelonectria olida]